MKKQEVTYVVNGKLIQAGPFTKEEFTAWLDENGFDQRYALLFGRFPTIVIYIS